MNAKWKIFIFFVSCYLLGMVGVGWQTFDNTNPTTSSQPLETIKMLFIMLGGLGVIIPTYLNIWQSLETSELLKDQIKRNIIENTFSLIQKWDDDALFAARKFTRELKAKHSTLSPDDIIKKINEDPDLNQSVILVFNYFDSVRVSIDNDRVDGKVISKSLGSVFQDIFDRFKPWIQEQNESYKKDLNSLSATLLKYREKGVKS